MGTGIQCFGAYQCSDGEKRIPARPIANHFYCPKPPQVWLADDASDRSQEIFIVDQHMLQHKDRLSVRQISNLVSGVQK